MIIFFQLFEILFCCLLSCIVSIEKSVVSLTVAPLMVTCLFFFLVIDFIFYFHSKIGYVQSTHIPLTSLPHTISVLHLSSTSVTIDKPTVAHCYHPNP